MDQAPGEDEDDVIKTRACQSDDDLHDSIPHTATTNNNNTKTPLPPRILHQTWHFQPPPNERDQPADNTTPLPHITTREILSSDTTSYGYFTWPCAHVLANYLLASSQRHLYHDKHVLEMGAGTGLVGLAVAAAKGGVDGGARSVTLTDGRRDVVHLLQHAIQLNQPAWSQTHCTVRAGLLDWTNDPSLPPSPACPPPLLTTPDLIIGSDILFERACFTSILRYIAHLLRLSTSTPTTPHTSASITPHTIPSCIISYQERSSKWSLTSRLDRFGLHAELIAPVEPYRYLNPHVVRVGNLLDNADGFVVGDEETWHGEEMLKGTEYTSTLHSVFLLRITLKERDERRTRLN